MNTSGSRLTTLHVINDELEFVAEDMFKFTV